jgi:hypothetical protein
MTTKEVVENWSLWLTYDDQKFSLVSKGKKSEKSQSLLTPNSTDFCYPSKPKKKIIFLQDKFYFTNF